MQWQQLSSFTLTQEWQCTDYIESLFFKVIHNVSNPYAYKSNALCALVGIDESLKITEIFKPQRISPLTEAEIIKFPAPPRNWKYRLAIKQLINPRDTLVNWEVKIEMPSYSLDDPTPVNQLATSTKNVTNVPVANTVTKILSANSARKGIKFYTADKNKTIYLDTDNIVSASSAIESISPSKPICVPTILWTGDWYAISPGGTVSIEVEEYV